MLSDVNQATDHEIAEQIATKTGELLVSVRAENADADPKELKTLGDTKAHDLIMEMLTELRPDDGILSEEGTDDLERLGHKRVWIVDPLDGTREYSEIPRTDWAVHIALTQDGVPTVGAVALPAQELTLSTGCLLYTSPSPRDRQKSRMPSSA